MQNDVSRVERTAALEISGFMQKEFSLTRGQAEARLHDNVLTIRLDHFLTSLGELILRSAPDDGAEAIEDFYNTAHDRLEALAARIAGAAVARSSMELDTRTSTLLMTFFFAAA